jgi:Zn-dependent protease with chaperone function
LLARSDNRQGRFGHRRVFRLQLALGTGGLLAAVAAVATAVNSVHQGPAVAPSVYIAGLRFTYPTLNAAAALLLVLAAVGASVMTSAVRAGWRQRQAYRGFMRQMGVLRPLDGHPTVKVIEDPQPHAFCAGCLRPQVYVSRGTLQLLSEEELEAVLAHEHHHRRVHDPLRFACARVLSQALFFVPVLRPLGDRYGDLAELRADEAAVRAAAGEKGPLASALLIFEANGPAHGAGISPERVDSLLGQPAQWRLPPWLLATSLASLSGLAVLMWRAGEVASAHATLSPPILSSAPCLVMLMLPLVGCIGIVLRRHHGGGNAMRLPRMATPH